MKKIIILSAIVGIILAVLWRIEKPQKTVSLSTQKSPIIAFVTDIDHCQTRNPVDQEKIYEVVAGAKEINANILISLGDNISHRRGTCSETADQDLSYITETLKTFGENTYFVLGDHDIESSQSSEVLWKKATHTKLNKGENYFSFDAGDVHVVVLDTILGGDSMSPSCKVDQTCIALKDTYEKTKTPLDQKRYRDYKRNLSLTRDATKRDKGRIGEDQLNWLARDLAMTKMKKILITSDHPLFPFTNDRKTYQIVGQRDVSKVLTRKKQQSNAQIITISGGVHIWHHEIQGDIHHYMINENKKENAWAYLTWDKDPILTPVETVEKATDQEIDPT